MKKIIHLTTALFTACCLLPIYTIAQTTINNTSTPTDPSSMLDINSTDHGFLVPRMTAADRLMIGSPAKGLFLFQTNEDAGFQYNSGTNVMPTWTAILPTPDTLLCDNRVPMDSVGNGQPPFTITEPGSYYFTKDIILSTGNNLDGIRVEASYVTIDLNGFTLQADPNINTSDGIDLIDEVNNITIKNGKITGWGADGINGQFADECTFKNLHLLDNGQDGLVTDFNGLIMNCVAINNGIDGLEGNDGTIIVDCIARENEDNGIQVSEGSTVLRCLAYDNKTDGFDIGAGSRIEDCTAYRNEVFGFDVALAGQVIHCQANDNGGNGFDMASSCLLMNSSASSNGYCINDTNCGTRPNNLNAAALGSYGNGVRTFANSIIINCTFIDNDRTGIRTSSTDCYISNNVLINNTNVGIYSLTSGTLILNNTGRDNGQSPNSDYTDSGNVVSGNFVIPSNSAFGPIINVSGGGDISTKTNSDHPFANFEY